MLVRVTCPEFWLFRVIQLSPLCAVAEKLYIFENILIGFCSGLIIYFCLF